MAKVKSPNTNFNGIRFGVGFTDGVGYTQNPKALAWFRRNGYHVFKERDSVSDDGPPAPAPKKKKTKSKPTE